jgi:hypothetical protein
VSDAVGHLYLFPPLSGQVASPAISACDDHPALKHFPTRTSRCNSAASSCLLRAFQWMNDVTTLAEKSCAMFPIFIFGTFSATVTAVD